MRRRRLSPSDIGPRVRGLLPLEVQGEVEWLVNRTETGWLVALFNPAGNTKTQHGIGPTDYAQKRPVTIRTKQKATSASEWFTETILPVDQQTEEATIRITVPAGGVRLSRFGE